MRGVWKQGKVEGRTQISEIGGKIDDIEKIKELSEIDELDLDDKTLDRLKGRLRSIKEAFRIPERLKPLMK